MDESVWLENVCNQLERDPREATRILTEFRDSDRALDVCVKVIQVDRVGPIALFHACSVLHHNLAKHWCQLESSMVVYIEQVLLASLNSAVTQRKPAFVIGKLSQAHALTWKWQWGQESREQREQQFQLIEGLQSSPATFRVGVYALLGLIEEMSAAGSVPWDGHKVSMLSFENDGLERSLVASLSCLTHLSVIFPLRSNCGWEQQQAVDGVLRLILGILNWDFGGNNGLMSRMTGKEISPKQDILLLPNSWSKYLLQHETIGAVYSLYNELDSVSGANSCCTKEQREAWQGAQMQCLLVITALGSISGKFYANASEKSQHVSCLLQHFLPTLEAVLVLPTSNDILLESCRSKQLTQLSVAFFQLVDNFGVETLTITPYFGPTIISLAKATLSMSSELGMISEIKVDRQSKAQHKQNAVPSISQLLPHLPASSIDNNCAARTVSAEDLELLDSWRGEVLLTFLLAWNSILEDPLMAGSCGAIREADSCCLPDGVKAEIQGISRDVFGQLFSCLMRITWCEVMAGAEEEEEMEEIEDIESTKLDTYLAATCAVGRVAFEGSLSLVLASLNSSLEACGRLFDADSSSSSTSHLLQLELQRTSLLFLTHLFVDNLSTSNGTSDKGNPVASETPVIPGSVIDCIGASPRSALEMCRQSVFCIGQVLQLQRVVLVGPLGANHPMFSPLIFRMAARFYEEYFARYLHPDAELYEPSLTNIIVMLHQLHADSEFDKIFGFLLECLGQIIERSPFETCLVAAFSDSLLSIARVLGGRGDTDNSTLTMATRSRLDRLFATEAIGEVFRSVSVSRLSLEGLTAVNEALAGLCVQAGNAACYGELCTSVYNKLEAITDRLTSNAALSSASEVALRHSSSQVIASIRGISRWHCRGQARIFHRFLQASLPRVSGILQKYLDADDVVVEEILLIRDLAEIHLPGMPLDVSKSLYQAVLFIIDSVSKRFLKENDAYRSLFRTPCHQIEESESFHSSVLLYILQLLNHLATKDFLLEEDSEATAVTTLGEKSFVLAVSDVLLQGLELILPMLTADSLRLFPRTSDRYFCFVSLVVSSYEDALFARWAAVDYSDGGGYLVQLVEHLLWSAGAVEPISARLALQSLQQLGTRYYKEMASSGARSDLSEIFYKAMVRLLEMLILPDSAEYGIATDRIDFFANCLAVLIAINAERFESVATSLVSRHPAELQKTLLQCFQKLTQTGGVSLTKVDRSNRQLFVRNFRVFFYELRSQIAATGRMR